MKNQLIFGVIVTLIVGLGIGYFAGMSGGQKKGYDMGYGEGIKAGVEQEKNAAQSRVATPTPEIVPQVVNPAEVLPSTNPLENVKTNPFEGVQYQNPFK